MPRCAVILAAALALAPAARASGPVPDRSLPSCALSSLDGAQSFDLQQLRGSSLWVDFWASWCDSCVASFAFLDALDRDFRAKGLKVLAISVDEDRDDAREFLARHPVGFAIAVDSSGSCPRSFAIPGMPAAYLIDRDGRIRHEQIGFRPGDAEPLRKMIGALLAEGSGPSAEPERGAAAR
jgi:thiol-disulfide isomerase/thioredoxin